MLAIEKIRTAGFDVALMGDQLNIRPARNLTQQQHDFLKTHKTKIAEQLKVEQDAKEHIDIIDGDQMKFGVLEVKIFRACSARGDDWEHIKEMIRDCRNDYPPEKWPGLWEYFDQLEKRWQ